MRPAARGSSGSRSTTARASSPRLATTPEDKGRARRMASERRATAQLSCIANNPPQPEGAAAAAVGPRTLRPAARVKLPASQQRPSNGASAPRWFRITKGTATRRPRRDWGGWLSQPPPGTSHARRPRATRAARREAPSGARSACPRSAVSLGPLAPSRQCSSSAVLLRGKTRRRRRLFSPWF